MIIAHIVEPKFLTNKSIRTMNTIAILGQTMVVLAILLAPLFSKNKL